MHIVLANLVATLHGLFVAFLMFGIPTALITGNLNTIWGIIFFILLLITTVLHILLKGCFVTKIEKNLRLKSNPNIDYRETFLGQYSPFMRNSKMKREHVTIFLVILTISLGVYLYLNRMNMITTNLTKDDLKRGWYWGSKDQKKQGTPSDWVFTGDGSRSDCWHKPNVACSFLPYNQVKTKEQECYEKVLNQKCEDGTECIVNPASSFCECMGGKSEILTDETSGNQFGICKINNQILNEWDYLRSNTPSN